MQNISSDSPLIGAGQDMQFLSTYLGDNKLLQFSALFAALALLIILAVVIVRLLFTRRLRAPGGRGRQARLGVVDAFDLDRQRQLVLVRRDNVEHLIMIGGPTDVVIETSIMRSQTAGAQRDKDPQSTTPPAMEAPRAPSAPAPQETAPPRAEAPRAVPQPASPAPQYAAEPPRQPPRPVAPPPLPPRPAPLAAPPPATPQPPLPWPQGQGIPVVLAPPESAPVRPVPPPVAAAPPPRPGPGPLAVPSMLEHLVRDMPPPPQPGYSPRPLPPQPVARGPVPPVSPAPPPPPPPVAAAAVAVAKADDPFDSLEAEMAKLLGR